MIIGLFFLGLVCCASPIDSINIVPWPVSVNPLSGVFLFHEKVTLNYPKGDEQVIHVVNAFNDLFKNSVGIQFDVVEYEGNEPATGTSQVVFVYDNSIEQEEGYTLKIEPFKITIKGKTAHGMFHAFTTIRQMLPEFIESKNCTAESAKNVVPIQCVEILDYPRYPYRGFMLDTCRHFSTVEQVKRLIDLLALHKMSVFHFHLSDDQGWRIHINKYPKLTEIGAWRGEKSRTNEVSENEDEDQGYVNSGKQNDIYGGFYTQDEIKEIVKYASERFIRIQPEIETPGHAVAAIASYPWLSCSGKEVKVITSWGIFSPVFCTKDEVVEFLQDVLTEVMNLFPGNVIHVGGDECPTHDWSRCENCKKQMEKHKLTSVGHLHGYLMKQLADHAKERGRRLIGWDEIAHAGYMDPDEQVMVWRSPSTAYSVAKEGHDVVLSPMSHCYFDFSEANEAALENEEKELSSSSSSSSSFAMFKREYPLMNRVTSRFPLPPLPGENSEDNRLANAGLKHVYDFDPLGLTIPRSGRKGNNEEDEVNAAEWQRMSNDEKEKAAKHVIGGQANLWTERLPRQENRDYNTFPRLAALSEALWTPKEKKDYTEFHKRLSYHLVGHYKTIGINYNPANILK